MVKRFKMHVTPMAHHWIVDKFYEMEDFKRFLDSAIEKEKKLISERGKKATAGMSKEEADQYFEMLSEDYFMVADIFSKISFHSFLVILYAFIEEGMNNLCDALRQDKELKLRRTDMKGKGIKRAKVYLTKVIGIDLQVEDEPWREINALRKIRNAIVHDEGWASDQIVNDVNIRKNVDKGFLEIEDRDGTPGKVIIKPEYLDWVVSQAQEFFRNIDTRAVFS